MSTDPDRREAWEEAVRMCLNKNAEKHRKDEYVILRGGQLVGASLSVFVRADCLTHIKNVEGALKKVCPHLLHLTYCAKTSSRLACPVWLVTREP